MDKQFLDPRSYMAPDGREVLYGDDWKARKWDLWQRCGGRCEHVYMTSCPDAAQSPIGVTVQVRCTAEAVDPHHLEKRSIKRDDRLASLIALCRFHHDLQHPEKQARWTR